MPSDNKLELVVRVDVDNAGLSSIEQTAAKTVRGASAGIDGMTTYSSNDDAGESGSAGH